MKLEELSRPEVLKSLVQSGRAPFGFLTLTSSDTKKPDNPTKSPEPETAFFVPPAGTVKGDQRLGDPLDGYFFKSPNGEERGWAELFVVPDSAAETIRLRVQAILNEIDL